MRFPTRGEAAILAGVVAFVAGETVFMTLTYSHAVARADEAARVQVIATCKNGRQIEFSRVTPTVAADGGRVVFACPGDPNVYAVTR